MQIRIRPPLRLANEDIDLGTLEFPKQWLHAPGSNGKTPSEHVCAQLGRKWCGVNGIDARSDSQYRFDRAVWTVTIIDTLLFDCQTGRIAISFIEESGDDEYAIIDMSVKLLLDLNTLVNQYVQIPEEPDTIRALHQAMLSFCVDVYSSYVLHELKRLNFLPANYFIWIAQMKRKQLAQDACLAAKEIAELIYNLSGEQLDPELSDWVEKCIEEPPSDVLDFLLAHNSRQAEPTSSPDTSFEMAREDRPKTPDNLSSDNDTLSDDSPTPAGDINVWDQYRDDFRLTADLLRHVDGSRMARLLPPRLSKRGFVVDLNTKLMLCGLEARVTDRMNKVREFEKLIEDEEKKEKELIEGYIPDRGTSDSTDESSDDEVSEKSYNLRARSSTPCIDTYGKKSAKKKQKKVNVKLPSRSTGNKVGKKKKKLTKTPEFYEEEWKRREDSPYPRRHSEMIVGKSASEMMRFILPARKKNFGFPGSKTKRISPSKKGSSNKRKLDAIQENEDLSIHKKLKTIIKIPSREQRAAYKGKRNGSAESSSSSSEEEDELAEDVLYEPGEDELGSDKVKKKKRSRGGKDLGHRRQEADATIPPSTANYLNSLRAPPLGRYASSGTISEKELAVLTAMASATASSSHLGSPSAYPSNALSSSSSSMQVDSKEDAEPGWEIKARTPFSSRSLSHASSRSNTPPLASRRPASDRPPLRRENSGIHPNAFIVGLPANFSLPTPESAMELDTSILPVSCDETTEEVKPQVMAQSSPSSEEDELDTDEDELELGIISPEKPRISTLTDMDENEGSLLEETWPEIEKMPCSPEDIAVPPQKTVTEQPYGLESLQAGSIKGMEDDPSNSTPLPSPTRPLVISCDPLDDAGEEAEAAQNEAAIRRLRESLQRDLVTGEVPEPDINFVRQLFEQCEMVVHQPTPIGESPPPAKKPKKSAKSGGLTTVPSSPKSGPFKTKAITGQLPNFSVELARSPNIDYIKSPRLSNRTLQPDTEVTSSSEVPTMKPASSSTPTTPRRVTVVYPSKRNKAAQHDKSAPKLQKRSSLSGLPRPSSPYRKSIEASVEQISVSHFLDNLLDSDVEDEIEEEKASVWRGALKGRPEVTSREGGPTADPDATRPFVTSTSTSTATQAYKIPLTPSKLVKQKRYPGMLVSPEPPEKIRKSQEIGAGSGQIGPAGDTAQETSQCAYEKLLPSDSIPCQAVAVAALAIQPEVPPEENAEVSKCNGAA